MVAVRKAKTATKKVTTKAKVATRNYVKNIASPTPRWAKWCRNIAAICTGVGGGIKMYPEEFPDFILQYENKIILLGVITMLIFQSFKKQ